MSARVLVVDDVEANVRLLEAKLTIEYFDVVSCHDGAAALALAAETQPDLILLDVMMPGMDGFETCRRLKAQAETRHIPVVLVTALDGREDRIRGLEAGADDFLTKPIDDVILFARVRSLTRLKQVMDELREREENSRRMGVSGDTAGRLRAEGGRVLVVDDNERQANVIAEALGREHRVTVETDADTAMTAIKGPLDLIIVNVAAEAFDGLRIVALSKSGDARRAPILAVVDPMERARMVKALELGAHLCRTHKGRQTIRRMILEDIDAARARGDAATASRLDLVLHGFVGAHEDLSSAQGDTLEQRIQALGLVRIADDVTPELALEAIESITVLGALHASPRVKAALAGRIH